MNYLPYAISCRVASFVWFVHDFYNLMWVPGRVGIEIRRMNFDVSSIFHSFNNCNICRTLNIFACELTLFTRYSYFIRMKRSPVLDEVLSGWRQGDNQVFLSNFLSSVADP
jgi:hypothetical protein